MARIKEERSSKVKVGDVEVEEERNDKILKVRLKDHVVPTTAHFLLFSYHITITRAPRTFKTSRHKKLKGELLLLLGLGSQIGQTGFRIRKGEHNLSLTIQDIDTYRYILDVYLSPSQLIREILFLIKIYTNKALLDIYIKKSNFSLSLCLYIIMSPQKFAMSLGDYCIFINVNKIYYYSTNSIFSVSLLDSVIRETGVEKESERKQHCPCSLFPPKYNFLFTNIPSLLLSLSLPCLYLKVSDPTQCPLISLSFLNNYPLCFLHHYFPL